MPLFIRIALSCLLIFALLFVGESTNIIDLTGSSDGTQQPGGTDQSNNPDGDDPSQTTVGTDPVNLRTCDAAPSTGDGFRIADSVLEDETTEAPVPVAGTEQTAEQQAAAPGAAEDYQTLTLSQAMAASLEFTQRVFNGCVDHMVIAEVTDLDDLALAARLAAFRNAPLLVNAVPEESDSPDSPDASGQVSPSTSSTSAASPTDTSAAPAQPDPVYVHPDVLAEFSRLKPLGISVIGSIETAQALLDQYVADGLEPETIALVEPRGTASIAASIEQLMEEPDADVNTDSDSASSAPANPPAAQPITLPRPSGPATPAALQEAIVSNAPLSVASIPVLSPGNEVTVIEPRPAGDQISPAETLSNLADLTPPPAASTSATPPELWLIAENQSVLSVLALPALAHINGSLLYVNPTDLRGSPRSTLDHLDALTTSNANTNNPSPRIPTRLVGPMPADHAWQFEVITNPATTQLPGGGYLLFPDRRIVAMYGHINTDGLGVLGEQDAVAGIDRALEIAAGYDADGIPVVTAFEIITTLASSAPNFDNSYSLRTPIAELRPWIDEAAAAGMYVILDLQPGRSDFLTQARAYEELLKLPHVGLALDPEWRLKPDQVHLRQIGTVDSAEVNQVIDWLADLVRQHRLPQKLLMVHQFSFAMISNRADIRTTPELAVMIHMDGQGSVPSKYTTYEQLTRGTEDTGWWWGWKNFYDEDIPGPISSEEVLEVSPLPYLVSYQ